MTLPSSKMEGWQWLHGEKDFQLIKLGRRRKVPVRGERVGRATRRSFESVKLDRNANAGVLTGRISGIIVLDIDNAPAFPSDYEVPDTLTVKSCKGFHHYFRLPNDAITYGNRSISDLGFDIKCESAYVVAPWSKHPDGTIYRIIEDAEIAAAPQWLLDLSATPETDSNGEPIENRIQGPQLYSISEPDNFIFPTINESLVLSPTPKGKRSEKIWLLLNELVEQACSDEDIIYLFESNKDGIGQKYFEAGAGRVGWLVRQIEKVRREYEERYKEPVEANDQDAVISLTLDIKNFIEERSRRVTEEHEKTIQAFVNLLIAIYEGSVTGWFAVPIPVGGGKTVSILHFVKYLYENDSGRDFPISVAFEKIEEIERAAEWLEANGVSSSFFQKVHHLVDNPSDVFESLSGYPVLLHTHQKLTGSSYITDYFNYRGQSRRLLIFDESMLNSVIHAELCQDLASRLSAFSREYILNGTLQQKIPIDIKLFFDDFNKLIERSERQIVDQGDTEIAVAPDVSRLDNYNYPQLVKYSRIIENEFGETDLYRNILLVCKSPEYLRKMSITARSDKASLLITKELLDNQIENLITTDASREFRKLFRYSQRSDGKKVLIYNTENFRWDDELGIWCHPENSGMDSVKKAFEMDGPNPYLDKIAEIVKNDNDECEEEGRRSGVNCPKRKYLFFTFKRIKSIPCQVKLRLLEEGLIEAHEMNDRLKFETFGRETATNEYSDCDGIIFIGLLHKPNRAIDALLAGEGFVGDVNSVRQSVEIGEFLHQLQQGIGRGAIRRGGKQFVHFFHPDPSLFEHELQDAFPMCYYNGLNAESNTEYEPVESTGPAVWDDIDW